MTSFALDVEESFASLIQSGRLSISRVIGPDPNAFGDTIVEFTSLRFRLCLVRDRGLTDAEVVPAIPSEGWGEPPSWTPLTRVLLAVGVSDAAHPYWSQVNPRQAAGLIEKYYDELEPGLSGKQLAETAAKLAEINPAAQEEWLRRHPNPYSKSG